MKKAVIYTRAKTRLSDFNLASISAQVLICTDYAKKNDLEIIGLYTDIYLCGTEQIFNNWNSIMRIKKPSFDTVLVYEMSRIGRNTNKAYHDILTLRERGVRVVSATNGMPADIQDTWLEFLKWCKACIYVRK